MFSGSSHRADEWLETPPDDQGRFFGPSVQWFLDPSVWDIPLSIGGPDDWQRIEANEEPERRPADPVKVTNIDQGRDSISFEVDKVGSPTLVKTSYFPNWQATGAEGPWRVAPNLMVVVPTGHKVELHYGTTPVEWLAYLVTAAGIVGLAVLGRRSLYAFRDEAVQP